MRDIVKLDSLLKAACPIDGVSIGRWGDKTTWRIDFKDAATPAQRAAAEAVMAAFDPDAPEDTAALDIETLNAALAEPGSIVRGLALTMLDEINLLRQQAGLAQRTLNQLKTAINSKRR